MIRSLQEGLRAKKFSSVELTQACLKKTKADATNSFITITDAEALEAAKQADVQLASGKATALTGIPVGIKDIFCTRGVRTTCASKILGEYKPPYDATSVSLLKRDGAVILGKLNMDEFAMGGSNENSAFGPVKNPVNLEYVAGGSSGGSAAAVRAGLVLGSLGTDTGGSVRLPAGYCGIVGLKPTYGRVSRYGVVAFASSLDQVGPMALSVEDCAIMLSSIAAHDPKDSTSAREASVDYVQEMAKLEGQKLKIGIPKQYFIDGIDPEIVAAVEKAKQALQNAGHEIVEVSLPHTEYSVAVYYIVAVSEASSNLARFDGVRFGERKDGDKSLTQMYKSTRTLFGDEVKRRILLGTFALSSGYYDAYYKKACQVRRLIRDDFQKVFTSVDALLTPVSPTPPYKLGEKLTNPLQMYLNDIFTIPANLAGLPGLALPAGRTKSGLPIGLQFIGPWFSEARLFALGQFVEKNVYNEFETLKGAVPYGI